MLNINLLNKPGEQTEGVDEKIIISTLQVDEELRKELKISKSENQIIPNRNFKFLIILTLIIFFITCYYLVIL